MKGKIGLVRLSTIKSIRVVSLPGGTTRLGEHQYNDYYDEAHALWGYIDWRNNFVPGLFSPTLLYSKFIRTVITVNPDRIIYKR